MNYRPTQNNLLVKPTPHKEQTDSGFYIPECARPTINEGTIIRCGESAGQFSPGQIVVWTLHSQHNLKIDGEELVLVSATDIVLIKEVEPAIESCKIANGTGQPPPNPLGNEIITTPSIPVIN